MPFPEHPLPNPYEPHPWMDLRSFPEPGLERPDWAIAKAGRLAPHPENFPFTRIGQLEFYSAVQAEAHHQMAMEQSIAMERRVVARPAQSYSTPDGSWPPQIPTRHAPPTPPTQVTLTSPGASFSEGLLFLIGSLLMLGLPFLVMNVLGVEDARHHHAHDNLLLLLDLISLASGLLFLIGVFAVAASVWSLLGTVASAVKRH